MKIRSDIRQTIVFSIFAMLSCVTPNFAQSGPGKPVCPELSVSGPAGIVDPGDMVTFVLTVTPDTFTNLEYRWEVSKGKVESGQFTTRIGVRNVGEIGLVPTLATVKVTGLPEGCPNEASESYVLGCILPAPELLYELSVPPTATRKVELGAAVKELLENPNNQMYIIEYFPPSTKKSAVNRKLALVRDHIGRVLKFDISRVTVVTAESLDGKPLTRIYRIPPGASNPNP